MTKPKQPCIYIMASSKRGTLYVGVTSDLLKRVYEHKNAITKGHVHKYNIHNLVYYEVFENMEAAILQEKRMKKWKREFKFNIIEQSNSNWDCLYSELLG